MSANLTKKIRSLALTVRFKNPDFGMSRHEVLSRATSFLLSVDPIIKEKEEFTSKHSHLEKRRKEEEERKHRSGYLLEPVRDSMNREIVDLRWLEFCPDRHRPKVHCVASSHVLAPWRWKQYYSQDWISHVKPEHCTYSLEVIHPDNVATNHQNGISEFPLNPFPIHHPAGLDLAIIHLQDEDAALEQMKDLGVTIMDTRDLEKHNPFVGEQLFFEGFQVTDQDLSEMEDGLFEEYEENEKNTREASDTRVFIPYSTTGELLFGSADRFIASTPKPLPQGLCGGPVFDSDDTVVGLVEGIVPLDHSDIRISGKAVFIPSIMLRDFLDNYAERLMLEEILPKDLFEKVVRLKSGKPLIGDNEKVDLDELESSEEEASIDKAYDEIVQGIRKIYDVNTTREILSAVGKETDQVIDIFNREGGDLDDVIQQVRARSSIQNAPQLEDSTTPRKK